MSIAYTVVVGEPLWVLEKFKQYVTAIVACLSGKHGSEDGWPKCLSLGSGA